MGSRASREQAYDVPYVLTMSTVPSRLNADLSGRIGALLDHLPHNFSLVLNVPHVLKRTNTSYPDIPNSLYAHPRVQIERVDDQGPITKVLPTLKRVLHTQFKCVLVVIDDDVLYPAKYIENLVRNVTPQSRFVKGHTSRSYYEAGRVPEGFKGYAIPSQVVTAELISKLEEINALQACQTADDYAMAAALVAVGIPLEEYDSGPLRIRQLAPMETDSLAQRSVASGVNIHARYNACKSEIGGVST